MVLRNSSIAIFLLMMGLTGFAQTAEPAPATARNARVERRGPPCWRQAGMTPDMVNQRWQIEDQQKVKIAQVCSEPTTSAQQKHDKIEQIHADTDRAVAQLIPTKELSAFNKCQADLDQRRPKPAGQKELGPCGGIIPANAESPDPATAPEHHHGASPGNH